MTEWLRQAYVSADGAYRYWLVRTDPAVVGAEVPYVLWVMLNPSTADDAQDDPTVRRVRGFSERLGYRRFVIVNLYAYRATDPTDLWRVPAAQRVGSENDDVIRLAARSAQLVVCAWGAHAQAPRVTEVSKILANKQPVIALAFTKGGEPVHPVRQPYDVLSRVAAYPPRTSLPALSLVEVTTADAD